MATWNLESVGTKGYGGGGSYFCARAAKAILKRKEERDEENYDGIGVFKDPLLDSVYGQCSSTTRPLRHSMQDDANDVADLLKPTELEQALAAARAAHGKAKSKHGGANGHSPGQSNRRGPSDQTEDIQVVFEEPFTSRSGRKGGGIPVLCIGAGEHTVYVLQVIYNGRRWSVERRYSEFDMLDREMQRMWAFDPSVRLGELPSKVWVGKLAKETQTKRKDELENYINNLLSQSKIVQESAELRAFLEVPPRNDFHDGPGPVISRPDSATSRDSWRERHQHLSRDFDEESL